MDMIVNRYKSVYDRIIKKAQEGNEALEIFEMHHIVPKSLGGTDLPDNLVKLSLRQHFLCHVLLTKFTTGQYHHKMVWALHRMAYSTKYKVTSRLYEYVRTSHIQNLKDNHPSKNPIWRDRVSLAVTEHWKENFTRRNDAREKMKDSWSEGKIKPKYGKDNGMYGKPSWNKDKKLPGTGLSGAKNPMARSYKIIDNQGVVYYTDCMSDFCREHKLQVRNMRNVATGKVKKHKHIVYVEQLTK